MVLVLGPSNLAASRRPAAGAMRKPVRLLIEQTGDQVLLQPGPGVSGEEGRQACPSESTEGAWPGSPEEAPSSVGCRGVSVPVCGRTGAWTRGCAICSLAFRRPCA